MKRYKIIRMYNRLDADGEFLTKHRIVRRGLTLEEAQAHCNDPATSSLSGTAKPKGAYDWFDGYEEE